MLYACILVKYGKVQAISLVMINTEIANNSNYAYSIFVSYFKDGLNQCWIKGARGGDRLPHPQTIYHIPGCKFSMVAPSVGFRHRPKEEKNHPVPAVLCEKNQLFTVLVNLAVL